MFESPLNNNTYLAYAARNYNNKLCNGLAEFTQDMKILSSIKRSLRKYSKSGDIKLQLTMNHIITLRNLFGEIPTSRILFFYCDTYTYPAIKTLLTFLDYCPDDIPEVSVQDIIFDEALISIIRNDVINNNTSH